MTFTDIELILEKISEHSSEIKQLCHQVEKYLIEQEDKISQLKNLKDNKKDYVVKIFSSIGQVGEVSFLYEEDALNFCQIFENTLNYNYYVEY